MRATMLRRIVAVLLVPLLGCNSVHRWQAEQPHEVGAGGDARSASARELEKLAFRQLGEASGHEVLLPEPLAPGWPFAVLFATLIIAWPVLSYAQHSDTRVDVFGAASGEIVWRYRRHDRPLGTVETSFGRPIEAPDPVAP